MNSDATRTLVVPAPAKVNLFLHVTGRRDDGYHLLESLFALVDLADTVTLALRDDRAMVRPRGSRRRRNTRTSRCGRRVRSSEATRNAARRVSRPRQAHPDGGGPRGGQLGCGERAGRRSIASGARAVPRTELARIGLTLGADVPFFVHGENAIVRGIGEAVNPVSLPPQWLALAMPPVHVPTRGGLRRPRIDTFDPLGENRRLFRGLRPQRSSARRDARPPRCRGGLGAWGGGRNARMTGSGVGASPVRKRGAAREAVARCRGHRAGRVVRTLVAASARASLVASERGPETRAPSGRGTHRAGPRFPLGSRQVG